MKVAVGSKNPVKISAVMNAFKLFFSDVELISVDSPSKVSSMPVSFEESFTGAQNRALHAMETTHADFSVGLEGGCSTFGDKTFLEGVVVIIDKNHKIGVGRSAAILLPEKFVNKIKEGKELGDVIDEITGEKDTKKKEGTIGFLTRGKLNREEEFRHSVVMALAPFINAELY